MRGWWLSDINELQVVEMVKGGSPDGHIHNWFNVFLVHTSTKATAGRVRIQLHEAKSVRSGDDLWFFHKGICTFTC